jgi:hypothetical protein
MWLYSEQKWGWTKVDIRHHFKCIKQSSHSKDLYYELASIAFINKELDYSFKDRIKHAAWIQDRTEEKATSGQLKFLVKAIFTTENIKEKQT